jgi:hypothetical protein
LDFGLNSTGRALAVFALASWSIGCATTGSSEAPFDAAVRRGEARCQCRIAVAARHIETGRTYERNGSEEFEAASVIKLAVLTEAMAGVREGRIDLSERWSLSDDSKADGSGTLLMLDPGLNPTWNDLTTLMIGPSDNTATKAWIARLGAERINARMESLGFPHIRLLATLPAYSRRDDDPSPWKGLRLGTITAHEVAQRLGNPPNEEGPLRPGGADGPHEGDRFGPGPSRRPRHCGPVQDDRGRVERGAAGHHGEAPVGAGLDPARGHAGARPPRRVDFRPR